MKQLLLLTTLLLSCTEQPYIHSYKFSNEDWEESRTMTSGEPMLELFVTDVPLDYYVLVQGKDTIFTGRDSTDVARYLGKDKRIASYWHSQMKWIYVFIICIFVIHRAWMKFNEKPDRSNENW